jgi:hypothetical protein
MEKLFGLQIAFCSGIGIKNRAICWAELPPKKSVSLILTGEPYRRDGAYFASFALSVFLENLLR